MRGALFILLFCLPACGQYTSIIPATNRVDWVRGSTAGVIGGIPTGRTLAATISAGASAATINSTIAAAADGTYVQFPVHTFNFGIDEIIGKSGVTLKGAPNDGTVFQFSDNGIVGGSVKFLGNSAASTPSTNLYYPSLTAGASNIATIAGGPAISVGKILLIIQDNEAERVQIYNGATNKMICESARVMAVSGTNITIWPPLSLTFQASLNPLYVVRTGAYIERAALEDVVIEPEDDVSYPIYLAHAYSCWISNVTIRLNGSQAIYGFANLNCEVRHCFLDRAASSGDGYGVNMDVESTFWEGWNRPWIEDNIFDGQYHGIVSSGHVAPVISFNYFTNSHAQSGVTFPTAAINLAHSAGGRFALVENNWIDTYIHTDRIHGNSTDTTLWRNRCVTIANAASDTNAHYPSIWLSKGSYWTSAAFNVLGHPGWSVSGMAGAYYDMDGPDMDTAPASFAGIWMLGYSTYMVAEETKVVTTAIRYQNYDYFNQSINNIAWSGGSPTGESSIIYPEGKPAVFDGLTTWPPISPSNPSGGPLLLQAGYRAWNGFDPESGGGSGGGLGGRGKGLRRGGLRR